MMPLVSVVIPTHERVECLRRALEGWEAQRPTEPPFEVVVVDDGSSDGTADVLAGWRSRRFALRFDRQPQRGPAAARNRALGLARGDLVLFTGDDIEPMPDLLAEHLAGHRALGDPHDAVLGLTRWPDDLELTSTMRHVDGRGAQQFSYHWMTDGATYDFRHLYTSNVSLRRELLDLEPDGFSTDFPAAAFEDAELGWRLARHGMRIHYRAAAVAVHRHRYGAHSFYRRQVRCGEMAARLFRMRPGLWRRLGVDELDRRRMAHLSAPSAERARAAEVAADLDGWTGRALGLAAALDLPAGEVAEPLLYELFRLAFLGGLGCGLLGPDPTRRLLGHVFLRRITIAVEALRRLARQAGRPVPTGDADRIAALAG